MTAGFETARTSHLQAILDALPAMVVSVDSRTRIRDYHPRQGNVVPGFEGDLCGKRCLDLIPDASCEAVAEAIQRARSNGLDSGTVIEIPSDEGPTWYELCISYVEDPEVRDAPYVLLFRDVSERIRMENELRESERRYRSLFETTGTACFIMEDDFTIILVNEEFEKYTGYSREEIVGKKTALEFLLPDSSAMAQRYHAMRREDPKSVPKKYEVKVTDRHGNIHDGFITVEMLPGTNRRVVAFMDTTDLKMAQRQMYRADKMAALGQLISGVAHEIKNPNHFIYVNVPVLEEYIRAMEEILDDVAERDPRLRIMNMPYRDFVTDLQQILDNMRHGSERITEIVSELRAYASTDEEQKKRPGRIQDVMQSVMTMVGKQVQKSVSRLDVEVEPDLPPVMMNPGGIEQVLTNLLINASQATEGVEDGRIQVQVRRSHDHSRYIEILLRDNGCGIAPEVREKIFEPYFTTKKRDEGTGLGLWVSHRIVEDHGGTLDVSSTEDVGSTFIVELPCMD